MSVCMCLQEAKEDAEMDAEIALEMAMEQERKLSTTSNSSSVDGAYVGPCPQSPGEVEHFLLVSLESLWRSLWK